MIKVWVLNWNNQLDDFELNQIVTSVLTEWVIEWLEVSDTEVSIGKAFVEVTRTWWETFLVWVYVNEAENITLWNNKKVYLSIDQTKIDDWLLISEDWTWVISIVVADNFPDNNFFPLAETDWAWVITDLRVNIKIKKSLQDLDWILWDINTTWDVHASFLYWDGSNITWIVAEVDSTSNNYMLWSSWVIGKAYSLVDYQNTTWGTTNNVWSTAQPMVSQSFFAQAINFASVILKVKKVSSPSDNIFVEIQTDNAWVPSGTVVTNGTSNNISYANLTTYFAEKTFTFASVPTLTQETKYHFVLKRTWSTDAVNFYAVESAWSDVQIGTMSKNTWSWANATVDLYFKITGYKLATLWWDNFVGICQLSWSAWEIVKFNKEFDNNQTWLTPWEYYWYDTSTWNIILWWNLKAISETEIVFDISYKKENIIVKLSWEAINKWDAVRMWTDLLYLDYEHTKGTSGYNYNNSKIGYSTTYYAAWQSFIADADRNLYKIEAQISKVWSPTGNLFCQLYANDGTTLLATSSTTITQSEVTWGWLSFDFDYDVSNWVEYRVKIYTNWTLSTSNHYQWWQYGSRNDTDEGTWYSVNSSNGWFTSSYAAERNMKAHTKFIEDHNKIFKASWANSSMLWFIWYAQSTVLIDKTLEVNVIWPDYSNNWLIPNAKYFLTDTAWQIWTTPWTYAKLVWQAITSEIMQIASIDQWLWTSITQYNAFSDWAWTVYTTSYYCAWEALITVSAQMYRWDRWAGWLQISSDWINWTTIWSCYEYWTTWDNAWSIAYRTKPWTYVRAYTNSASTSYDAGVSMVIQD